MKMKNHPNLEFAQLSLLGIGDRLRVQTHNTLYTISKLSEDEYVIRGSATYCPDLLRCHINGCTFGGSMLAFGRIFVGGHLEFLPLEGPKRGKTITTSPILSITRS